MKQYICTELGQHAQPAYIQDYLNRMAAEGWELKNVLTNPDNTPVLILERTISH